jgi:hypothetical protein
MASSIANRDASTESKSRDTDAMESEYAVGAILYSNDALLDVPHREKLL